VLVGLCGADKAGIQCRRIFEFLDDLLALIDDAGDRRILNIGFALCERCSGSDCENGCHD